MGEVSARTWRGKLRRFSTGQTAMISWKWCMMTTHDQERMWPLDQMRLHSPDQVIRISLSLFSLDGQVHSLVEDISRGLSRIFTSFINSIQGFFFCFIFAILLLAIGLRRNPNLMQIWWSAFSCQNQDLFLMFLIAYSMYCWFHLLYLLFW